jgi:peptidylamidoglycolate lyase
MKWGTKGKEDGEFNIPHSLSLDDNGNVYVADRENNRIQIFDSNGVFLKQLQNNEKVAQLPAITIDYKQNLLAVDYDFTSLGVNGSTIFQYDTNDKIVYQFGGIETSKRSKSWYHDISVDRDGNIYVGDIYANKVRKFRLKTYFPDGNEDK